MRRLTNNKYTCRSGATNSLCIYTEMPVNTISEHNRVSPSLQPITAMIAVYSFGLYVQSLQRLCQFESNRNTIDILHNKYSWCDFDVWCDYTIVRYFFTACMMLFISGVYPEGAWGSNPHTELKKIYYTKACKVMSVFLLNRFFDEYSFVFYTLKCVIFNLKIRQNASGGQSLPGPAGELRAYP